MHQTFFSLSPTILPVQSHGVLIFRGWYKGEYMPHYLYRLKMASCPLKSDVFFIPNLIKTYHTFVEPKMKGKYVTECSIAEKVTITWTVRAWRPKHREYEVSLSLLQIGSSSYHEVTLRSFWCIYGHSVCDDHCRNPVYRSAKLLLYFV